MTQKIGVFLLGVISTLLIIILSGLASENTSVGRYQLVLPQRINTASLSERPYLLDTVTGIVYMQGLVFDRIWIGQGFLHDQDESLQKKIMDGETKAYMELLKKQ